MAKTILTSILLVTTISVYAQEAETFQKGRVQVGGGFSFRFNDTDYDRTTSRVTDLNTYNSHSFNFSPQFGFYSKDYFLMGLRGNISSYENSRVYIDDGDVTTDDSFQTKEIGASIFLTHVYPIYKRFGANIDHEVGYSRTNGKRTYIDYYLDDFGNEVENEAKYSETGNIYSASISLDIYYSINDHFLVSTKIGELSYRHSNNETTDDGNNGELITKLNSSSGDINFITTLSFDKILTFNYLF